NMDDIDLPLPENGEIIGSLDALTTRRCMAGKHFFGITPDKKILPCSLIADHPQIPKVYFESPDSFVQLGRQMDAIFANLQDRLGGICSTCAFRTVCRGGCLAEKISFERNLDEEQPVCTKLILERIRERLGPDSVDRLVRSWTWQLAN